MTESNESTTGFAALGLDARLLDALTALGYEEPTPIQREAIPLLIAGGDLLGQAATGTGKTAAFALPMLHRLAELRDASGDERERPVRGLILVPTRELAMQVAEAVHKYGRAIGVSVLAVYGGTAIQQQLRALKRGVDVVVATPGRALDHVRRGSMDLAQVAVVVLDEADEMLDMGFAEDLEAILEALPETRQTALLSATMAPRVAQIAERHLNDPARVTIARPKAQAGEVPKVRQVAYVVRREHKVAALGRVLDMEAPQAAIVFCRTRTEVDVLTDTLVGRGYRAEALHGGFGQEQRDRVMRKFREGTVELLIATDVAARGLDIANLTHVVNFDVPSAPEAYVHRIGRTGRAGREGVAITFAEPREVRLLRNIESQTRQKIPLEQVPTAVDLRARRLELTRGALRELLLGGELDGFRVVVESLGAEFDVWEIAAAAVKLAHESTGGDGEKDDAEIPTVKVGDDRARQEGRRDRFSRERTETRAPRDRERPRAREGAEGSEDRVDWGGRPGRQAREERAAGGERPAPRRPRERGARGEDVTRLYIGVGRRSGVRPADLVGAIANEAGLDSRSIGAIDIADRFSLVEVPDADADGIIRALKSATIRGQRVTVRRDREGE